MAQNRPSTRPDDDPEIPSVPPVAVRPEYLAISRRYVVWCMGVLAWALMCVGYFIVTGKIDNMLISLGLFVLAILMIILPTVLFGGQTWHKRLGWITILLGLCSLLLLFPTASVVLGVVSRIAQGRYRLTTIYYTDVLHAVLAAGTIALHAWTAGLTWRAGRLVQRLARGDYA